MSHVERRCEKSLCDFQLLKIFPKSNIQQVFIHREPCYVYAWPCCLGNADEHCFPELGSIPVLHVNTITPGCARGWEIWYARNLRSSNESIDKLRSVVRTLGGLELGPRATRRIWKPSRIKASESWRQYGAGSCSPASRRSLKELIKCHLEAVSLGLKMGFTYFQKSSMSNSY